MTGSLAFCNRRTRSFKIGDIYCLNVSQRCSRYEGSQGKSFGAHLVSTSHAITVVFMSHHYESNLRENSLVMKVFVWAIE